MFFGFISLSISLFSRRDVLSLVNAVAALAVANPIFSELRAEVGPLLFHRLMYTTG